MEHWKDIQDFEGRYQVSSLGRIRSLARIDNLGREIGRRILRPYIHKNGYLQVNLWKGNRGYSRWAHRVVGMAFLPNERSLRTINHKNGIKTDNRVENLEWCSDSDNHKHAFRLGLMVARDMRGERGTNAKLKERDVLEIRRLMAEGMCQRAIARKYGVVPGAIWNIKAGLSWKHLTPA